jgi:hypothetical protein
MATFTWLLQSNDPYGQDTELRGDPDNDILQFAGAAFGDPIFVGEYNDSTHIEASGGADLSDGNVPNNNKFISQTGGTGGDSQVQVNGGSTVDLDTVTEAEAVLNINVADAASITVVSPVFFSYDPNQSVADPLAGIDVRAAEVGDANFTEAEGSGSPLELADSSTPSTSHDFYIVLSKGATATGVKLDTLRFEAVIQ